MTWCYSCWQNSMFTRSFILSLIEYLSITTLRKGQGILIRVSMICSPQRGLRDGNSLNMCDSGTPAFFCYTQTISWSDGTEIKLDLEKLIIFLYILACWKYWINSMVHPLCRYIKPFHKSFLCSRPERSAGASRNRIVRLSVHLSRRNSIHLQSAIFKVWVVIQ